MFIIGISVIIAYIVQMYLGMKQVKNFNKHYVELRRKGKVLIGVNKGNIVSGTIILLSIDDQLKIIEAKKMQGVSVFAAFKSFDQVVGSYLQELDENHPVLVKENKLTKKAILQAKKNYYNHSSGATNTYQPIYSISHLKNIINNQVFLYKEKFRKG